MRLGTREVFTYAECANCGALQRSAMDVDLARYYPPDYYAHALEGGRPTLAIARRARNWLALSPVSAARGVINAVLPHPAATWLAVPEAARDTRILDVGCGKGALLAQLEDAGFRSLTGADPFLPERVATGKGVRMLRAEIGDVDGEFDLVMFHHSLEHIADQEGALRSAARLLERGGWCIVRVPTVSSWAWEHYREDWFQIDAPRHLVLHSITSLSAVAARAGFEVVRIDYDSEPWQVLWSESYRRDVAMAEAPLFPAAETKAASAQAARLNAASRGDQVCVYLRKPSGPPAAR